ncbi:hypothetical protein [Streptomyces sp. NPDC059371]|uniref:hypothetical protein n=1 Tax=Streptomyces sp. NPDC059371 TaxID=3346812 RepID=UPI0036AF786A
MGCVRGEDVGGCVNTDLDAEPAVVTSLAAAELEQTVLRKLCGTLVEVTLCMLAQPLAGHRDHEGAEWAR